MNYFSRRASLMDLCFPVTSWHQLKRVTQQTSGGRKRSVSALVVVGNGRGAAGEQGSVEGEVLAVASCSSLVTVRNKQVLPLEGQMT